jgi:polyvinyl alcohol dehydrogenase (cytochrome)
MRFRVWHAFQFPRSAGNSGCPGVPAPMRTPRSFLGSAVPPLAAAALAAGALAGCTSPGSGGTAATDSQVSRCVRASERGVRMAAGVRGCTTPVVIGVGPSLGPVAGGGTVTIRGGDFAAGARVTFGPVPASKVTVVSQTEIIARVPSFEGRGGAVTVPVTVTARSGLSSQPRGAVLYRYYSPNWSAYLDGSLHASFDPAATSIRPATVADLAPVWQWVPPKSPNAAPPADNASPVVSDGTVYLGLGDGEMYALNEATQQVKWARFLGLLKPTTCAGYGGITSTATVAEDPVTRSQTVYVNGPDGYLYALDAATGAVIWKSLVGVPSARVNNYYAWGSPAVANGKVYIGIASRCGRPAVRGGVLAVDQHSGQRLAYWASTPAGKIGGSVWSSIAALPSGNVVASTGDFVGSNENGHSESIVVLSGSTLKLLESWTVPKAQQIVDGDFGGSPTVFTARPGGVPTTMVGACNKNGIYYALRADDLRAGPLWQHRMGARAKFGECDAAAIWTGSDLIEGGGSPTTVGGVSYPGSVQELNPTTGRPVWRTGVRGYVIGSPSEDGGGVIAAPVWSSPTGASGVYLLSAATGKMLKFISTAPAGDFAQPVFYGSELLIGAEAWLPLAAYAVTRPGQATPLRVAPGTLTPGTTEKVTVTGTGGFTSPARAFISGTSVLAASVDIVSPTTATVTVVVPPHAVAGTVLSLTLTEPDRTAYTCTSCLKVG